MSLNLTKAVAENQTSQAFRVLVVLLVCVGVLLGAQQTARADIITLEDFSGSEVVVDFTGLNVPQTPDPIVIGDLTIDSDVSDLRVTEIYHPFGGTPLASKGLYLGDLLTIAPSNIEFQFATPISRLGMWINGGNSNTNWTLSAFDPSDDLVGTHTFDFVSVAYPDLSTFAGIEFSTPFTRVTIVENLANGQFTNIDDIRFEPSESPVQESTWSRIKSQFQR